MRPAALACSRHDFFFSVAVRIADRDVHSDFVSFPIRGEARELHTVASVDRHERLVRHHRVPHPIACDIGIDDARPAAIGAVVGKKSRPFRFSFQIKHAHERTVQKRGILELIDRAQEDDSVLAVQGHARHNRTVIDRRVLHAMKFFIFPVQSNGLCRRVSVQDDLPIFKVAFPHICGQGLGLCFWRAKLGLVLIIGPELSVA